MRPYHRHWNGRSVPLEEAAWRMGALILYVGSLRCQNVLNGCCRGLDHCPHEAVHVQVHKVDTLVSYRTEAEI